MRLLCGRCFGLGCHAPGLCCASRLLGRKTRRSGARGLRFLLGAAPRLLRCLLFCRDAQQGGGFGALLDLQLLGGLIGRASLGFGPLCGQPGQFLFLLHTGRGGGGQLKTGPLAALAIRHGTLLRFDFRGKGSVSQTFGFDLPCRGLSLRCRALGLCGAGLLLGGETHRSGTRGFGFLLGASAGFAGRFIFSSRTRQGGRFGDLLEPQLFGGLVGGASFRDGTFRRQPGQFLFLFHAGRGGGGQFNAGTLAALGLRHCTLLRFDSRGKGRFSQTFGFDLLCSGLGLGCRALALCRSGLLLGGEARRSGSCSFGFPFDTSPGFAGSHAFGLRARQGCGFRAALDLQLLGGPIDRDSFGFGPLRCEPGQFFFPLDPGRGGNGQFGGSSLIAPGFLQRALLSLDLRAKGSYGETFGLRLGFRTLGL